ncbi:hypothetical protein ACFXAZ_19295 [Streptomyces sp. NPDC059477]
MSRGNAGDYHHAELERSRFLDPGRGREQGPEAHGRSVPAAC